MEIFHLFRYLKALSPKSNLLKPFFSFKLAESWDFFYMTTICISVEKLHVKYIKFGMSLR